MGRPQPNYRKTHAKPLPLDTFPLPPLLPNNPFSILQIAYVYLSHLLFPPRSHSSDLIRGYFSPQTNSVHITDPPSIRLLWESGFFGKGSLSRSEPTWLDRERKRVGLLGNDTSEDHTQQRRDERRKMKMERARREREAIEDKLMEEKLGPSAGEATATLLVDESLEDSKDGYTGSDVNQQSEEIMGGPLQDPTAPAVLTNSALHESLSSISPNHSANSVEDIHNTTTHTQVHEKEFLQLTAEEAFFLVFSLGVLQVFDESTNLSISTSDLLTLLRSHSHCPPLGPSLLTPHDPFLPSYAAYHHFRSLGWVVRPGIKFAVDWLLYLRGPAFAHAEFAVVVTPAFRDAYWRETASIKKETQTREKRDWWWLHCLQRVQAQVRKGLVICWVEIPRPETISGLLFSSGDGVNGRKDVDISRLLRQYKVRDMMVKRWIPNRSRD